MHVLSNQCCKENKTSCDKRLDQSLGFGCSCHLHSLSYWAVIEITLIFQRITQLLADWDMTPPLTGHVYIQVSLRRESLLFFHHQISCRCNGQALTLMMVMGHVPTSFWSFPNVGAGKDMIKVCFQSRRRQNCSHNAFEKCCSIVYTDKAT